MRDFAVVLIVLGAVPVTLVRPQVGVLMWFWLSLMSPHRLAWGYAQTFHVALVAGGATILAWLISREPKIPPRTSAIFALAALTFWVTVAAVFAIHPEIAIPKWEEIIKILLMTFVTTCIVQTQERIYQLVWVIVGSIGFYAIKGGIFEILTGGHYRVWGPPGTFIEDNNGLALAEVMLLPLMAYLRGTAEKRWLKLGITGAMALTVIAILGSYSRGGLVGLVIMLGYMILKSKHRMITGLAALGFVGVAVMSLPQQWQNRMSTIEDYQSDESVQGRFDAWHFAFRLALDHPLTGGGQLVGTDDVLFKHYVPTASTARAAHSIYFEVLGETGFVGLAIFLCLMLTSFRTGTSIIRMTADRPDLAWAQSLARMIQVAFIGYFVCGAFLSLGFFDLFYVLIAVLVGTYQVVKREVAQTEAPAFAPIEEPGRVSGRFAPPRLQPGAGT